VMLAGALQGVVCQQLLKTADGNGRVVATEVMVATSAIKNLIREGKTHQMYSIDPGRQAARHGHDGPVARRPRPQGQGHLRRPRWRSCNNVADFNRLCGRA
jgi:twitching motility protein PilT